MSTQEIPHRVDTHAHYLPAFYREACETHGHSQPDGIPGVPAWTVEDHLTMMDNCGIQKSILSISSPGTHLVSDDPSLAEQLTRDCNRYASSLKKRMPERFGYFASLPLPEVELSLEEINIALEEGCDGFVVLSNAHGLYLGDERLAPVFDELNRRRAKVFVHPTTPKCPCGPRGTVMAAAPLSTRYANPMLEFFFDTARMVTDLFLSGTVQRCPQIQFIVAHLGGAMPPLLPRWTAFSSLLPGIKHVVSQEEAETLLRAQFWFDMAGVPSNGQLKALLEGCSVHHSRLLYGSDYPFTNAEVVKQFSTTMNTNVATLFTSTELADVYHGNAERLLGAGL